MNREPWGPLPVSELVPGARMLSGDFGDQFVGPVIRTVERVVPVDSFRSAVCVHFADGFAMRLEPSAAVWAVLP